MQQRRVDPECAAIVKAGFVAHKRWLVYGSLTYHEPGPSHRASPAFKSYARFDFLLDILVQCRRGWDEGAQHVTVIIDGDENVAGAFQIFQRELAPSAPRRAGQDRGETLNRARRDPKLDLPRGRELHVLRDLHGRD